MLAALNKQTDRPDVKFTPKPAPVNTPPAPQAAPIGRGLAPAAEDVRTPVKKEPFFRTMTLEEYKTFSTAVQTAPQPKKEAAVATAAAIERQSLPPLAETILKPSTAPVPTPAPIPEPVPAPIPEPEPVQEALPMPEEAPWRMVGELYNSYILVEQGEEAFLIDKHAAHERILFEKLKENQEAISSQMLLQPISVGLSAEATAELLAGKELLLELGFEIEEFGDNTVLLRQIPMDLSPEHAADAVEELAADLMRGRREKKTNVRDEVLHTVACKAAIKAGWVTSETELLVLVKQVMAREDLKYCPHGRPICITLSKKQLEKQFKRS